MSPSESESIDLHDLTVILVTYNSAHCLPGLNAVLAPLPRLIFVDNASSDDTVDTISVLFPNAVLMRNEHNQGFGAANNLALQKTTTKYALILNPDTLPASDFFSRMVLAAENFPDAAMIAPQLVRRNGSAEINYRWPGSLWHSTGPAAEGPCCVGFACGAAILFHMENMRKVGFFDEKFFLYYEDEDLSQRAFIKRIPIIVVPDIQLTHLSRGSVKGQQPLRAEFLRGFHHAQSKLLFEQKYGRYARWLRWKTLMLALMLLPLRLLFPQPKYVARLLGRIVGLLRARPFTLCDPA